VQLFEDVDDKEKWEKVISINISAARVRIVLFISNQTE